MLAELVCQRIPDLVHMVTPDREYDVHCTSVGYILCMTDPVSSATGKYIFCKTASNTTLQVTVSTDVIHQLVILEK